MKKTKIITTVVMIIVFLFFIINPVVKATINPDNYGPNPVNPDSMGSVGNVAKAVINTISVIGAVVSVIILIVIGIKYMIGTIEEKAEYRKTMLSYIIGAIMIFGISGILSLVANFTQNTIG